MTPERWRLVEKLYHSACERGPTVLEGTDPELRREVERLLLQESDGGILDQQLAELMEHFSVANGEQAPLGFAGQTISHYNVLERLGAGGMGVIYKAFDTKLNRLVALKFLAPHLSHDEELKRRLGQEARAASALDHPNIVVIHDIDETPGGDVFIAMAFHEGVTLREKIASENIPVKEALQIARQIASGLAKAHEHGIFHRDIKPGNIIIARDGVARIIDFGLAKSHELTASPEGTTRGTPLYMSPEQASGRAVDFRTDLWSLGAVLYQVLAGRPPFRGDTQLRVIHAVVNEQPPRLRDLRPEVPPEVVAIVSKALQKDPADRYQSAAEMVKDLSGALLAMESPQERAGVRAVYAISAAVLLMLAVFVSIWLYRRSENRNWAREQLIPEIARLKEQNRSVAAFRVMHEAQKYLAGDPQLTQIADGLTHAVSVRSSPPGASVEIKDYLSPDDAWSPVGKTPIDHVKIPNGYLRWRVSKKGLGEYVAAPITEDIHGFLKEFNFSLDVAAGAPQGMVPVPATRYEDYVWSLGDLGPYFLPAFYIDRFEVTNREYQEFVDRGGYAKREYWKEKFVRDGRELSWDQAMGLLRDSTGHPGPSTWRSGHYPTGLGDYPVGGVSWYEASAYAEFAGKSLPIIGQWYLAAPSAVAKFVTAESNFSAALARVGKYQGVGPFGTYDMAGNVAEWSRNASTKGTRYQLGGAWNTASREYIELGPLPPFHRAANAGFRCVRNTAALPPDAVAERRQTIRDFSKAKPASDEIFRVYKAMYAYDRTTLNAKPENVAQDSGDWHKEKIIIAAAYGKERIPLYLFVPRRGKPPYQTVVFYPSARVLDLQSSNALGDMQFVDFIIQSGRAGLYPVYKGTYERPAPMPEPSTVAGRETLIQDSKDMGRSIDYIETRSDIDATRIAFLGVSMGAALGVDWAAVEDRFKAVIMLDGGFYLEKPLQGTDQADFAPHLKAPTLLIAGKFDWIFLGKDALVRMLGAPSADKKVVLLDTSHNVSEQRADMVREVLAWLDRYLGNLK